MATELCIVTSESNIYVFLQPAEAVAFFLNDTTHQKVYKLRTWSWKNVTLEEMDISDMIYEACINMRPSAKTGVYTFKSRVAIANGPNFPIWFSEETKITQEKMQEAFQKRLELRDSKRNESHDLVSPQNIAIFLSNSCCVVLERVGETNVLKLGEWENRRKWTLDFLRPFFMMLGLRVNLGKV